MTGKVQRLLREVTEARKRRKDHATLDVDVQGFTFTRRGKAMRLKWDEVAKIAAGTRAMMAAEIFFVLVCGAGLDLQIDEFVDGFRNLEVTLIAHFPTIAVPLKALQMNPVNEDRLVVLWQAGRDQP